MFYPLGVYRWEESLCGQEVTSAGCVRLDLKMAALGWKRLHQLRCHGDIGRFLGVFALDVNAPTGDSRGQQQAGRKLRAFFDTYRARARTWSGSTDCRRQPVIGRINCIAQLSQRIE